MYICIMKNILMLVVFLMTTQFVSAQEFYINDSGSKVEWFATKVTGKHNGDIKTKEGNFTFEKNKLKAGKVVIDMNTINTTDIQGEYKDKLDGHLKAADFFDVSTFPESVLVIKSVKNKKGKGTNTIITADLTIKGVTNEIIFPANILVKDNNAFANASITIDRTKWNIVYGSGSVFKSIGDKAINDNIVFKIKLELIKK